MSKLVPLELKNGSIAMVSELKVNELEEFLSLFPSLPELERVILFGSTLEERCNEKSDIDLCYLYSGDYMTHEYLLECTSDYNRKLVYNDILGYDMTEFYSTLNFSVERNIKHNGVIIYDGEW